MAGPAIFISHSHFDNAFCEQLSTWLVRTVGADVFYDRERLHGGDDWLERIQTELERRPLFVLVLSQHSIEATWVRAETRLALDLTFSARTHRVIPISIDPSLTRGDISKLSSFLHLFQRIDLSPGAPQANWQELANVIAGTTSERATDAEAAALAPRLERSLSLVNDAHEAFAQQQWYDVVLFAKRALDYPDNTRDEQLYAELAQAQYHLGQQSDAVASLRRALELNEFRGDYWMLLAQWAMAQTPPDMATARTAWENAYVNTKGRDAREQILIAQVQSLIAAQHWQEAQDVCRRGLQFNANNPDWRRFQQQAEAGVVAEREAAERAERERAARERQQREAAEQQRLASLVPASLRAKGFVARSRDGVEMIVPPVVAVPAGAFLMGSDKRKDAQAQDNETPQQTVQVGAFEISVFPLTVAEYARFGEVTKRAAPGNWSSQQQHPDHPVVYVSWNDALAYAQWLAQVTGERWRLPTEAEWEKAARGTDGRIYPWGNQWDNTRANTSDGGPKATTPVGSYPSGASPYGALDMAGNVWEWTSTTYKPYPYQANDGREDLSNQTRKVLRGGAWGSNPRNARAACRGIDGPTDANLNIGARLVRGVRAG